MEQRKAARAREQRTGRGRRDWCLSTGSPPASLRCSCYCAARGQPAQPNLAGGIPPSALPAAAAAPWFQPSDCRAGSPSARRAGAPAQGEASQPGRQAARARERGHVSRGGAEQRRGEPDAARRSQKGPRGRRRCGCAPWPGSAVGRRFLPGVGMGAWDGSYGVFRLQVLHQA
ncbi:microtubule cross-linking factor 1-like isoform X2 [Rhineura floridana]|uniref:microtubule cross-linking factor 1-like isoform X2 n=1 Tax=Rhineura floridana TaxID=261503 RepID=UPI002AC83569|nr:microtubule cross-linking factor 1-like isoform X2 [Rhineura floridana]